MKYNLLGRTDLKVSELCLGSMTWGTQNTEAEAHQQISFAVDRGVNFIDTAELYPTTPLSAETQGLTEAYIGTWLKKNGNRDKVVIATKITSSGDRLKWIRNAGGISPTELPKAVDGSLKRLQTDVIDLYQLHWPMRGSYHFRQNWTFDPTKQDRSQTENEIYETLDALGKLIAAGKIRHVGLSNESAWGTAKFLDLAKTNNFPRIVSIQNEYSLMCRQFDTDLAELSHHEDVGLLAYSPLAAGLLSGKYLDGAVPAASRKALIPTLHDRHCGSADDAVRAYVAVAQQNGLDPSQMALAFCLTRPFMTSAIIGATTMEQLEINLGAANVALTDKVLDDLHAVYQQYPMPF